MSVIIRTPASLALGALLAVAACRSSADRAPAADTTSAAGSVVPASDSTSLSATTPAVGAGIQVSPSDERNVSKAIDLAITDDAWTKFLRASDSVAALRARDADVRRHLDQQIVNVGEDDAGRKWLEAEPKVVNAIQSAGLTVKDYYRLGITIASAARFIDNPAAAPPTPAGRQNAEYVRAHRADYDRLRTQSMGATTPVVAK